MLNMAIKLYYYYNIIIIIHNNVSAVLFVGVSRSFTADVARLNLLLTALFLDGSSFQFSYIFF